MIANVLNIVAVILAAQSVFGGDNVRILKADRVFGGEGELYYPCAIENSSDEVYVADTSDNRIVVYDNEGSMLRTFGSVGSRQGELLFPREMAVDDAGRVVVMDTGNNRVQIFQPNGDSMFSTAVIDLGYNASRVSWVNADAWVVDSNSWRSGAILGLYSAKGEKIRDIGKARYADHEWISVPAAVNKVCIDVRDGYFAVGMQTQAEIEVYDMQGEVVLHFKLNEPALAKIREWWWNSFSDKTIARDRMRVSIKEDAALLDDALVAAIPSEASCAFYISDIEIYNKQIWVMLDGDIYVYDLSGKLVQIYDMRDGSGGDVPLHTFSYEGGDYVWGLDAMHTHNCYRFPLAGS